MREHAGTIASSRAAGRRRHHALGHREAIDEIAEHLNDLHRGAIASGSTRDDADALVEAELARMGPLAVAVAERAKRAARPLIESQRLEQRHRRRFPPRDPLAPAQSQLLRHRRPDAGDRHRRVHRGLQHHQRAAARLAAVSESRQLTLLWETDGDNRDEPFIVAQPVYEDWKKRDAQLLSRWASGSTAPTTSRRRRNPSRCRHPRHIEPVHGARRARRRSAGSSPRRKMRLAITSS